MKKYLLSLLCLVLVVTLTVGCEKKEEQNQNNNEQNTQQEDKKLTCTMDDEEDKYKQETKYTINYKGDSVEKVVLQGTMKYTSGKYDEKAASKYADECNADLKKAKGISCNVQKSGSSIWVTYEFKLADLDDAGKEIADDSGINEFKEKSYDDTKSLLETAGFKCN